MCDLSSTEECQKMRAQDRLRDSIKESRISAYLECSESGDCQTGVPVNVRPVLTAGLKHAFDGVNEAIRSGDLNSSLSSGSNWSFELTLEQPTSKPPMLTGSNMFWETKSRPYEKQLVQELAATSGKITHYELMRTALKLCGNDTQLALLTGGELHEKYGVDRTPPGPGLTN